MITLWGRRRGTRRDVQGTTLYQVEKTKGDGLETLWGDVWHGMDPLTELNDVVQFSIRFVVDEVGTWNSVVGVKPAVAAAAAAAVESMHAIAECKCHGVDSTKQRTTNQPNVFLQHPASAATGVDGEATGVFGATRTCTTWGCCRQ